MKHQTFLLCWQEPHAETWIKVRLHLLRFDAAKESRRTKMKRSCSCRGNRTRLQQLAPKSAKEEAERLFLRSYLEISLTVQAETQNVRSHVQVYI